MNLNTYLLSSYSAVDMIQSWKKIIKVCPQGAYIPVTLGKIKKQQQQQKS